MQYKTEGIIIKKTNSGEFDRLLTVYSKDFGKILVKAKSVRKNQSKLKGYLELFLYNHLMIAQGRGLDVVTGAEIIDGFFDLHRDLPSLAVAHYFSELIDGLVTEPEKDENIWQLLLLSFNQLNQKKDIRPIVDSFEDLLTNFLGYGSQRKNFIPFVESLLNRRINSRKLLTKYL